MHADRFCAGGHGELGACGHQRHRVGVDRRDLAVQPRGVPAAGPDQVRGAIRAERQGLEPGDRPQGGLHEPQGLWEGGPGGGVGAPAAYAAWVGERGGPWVEPGESGVGGAGADGGGRPAARGDHQAAGAAHPQGQGGIGSEAQRAGPGGHQQPALHGVSEISPRRCSGGRCQRDSCMICHSLVWDVMVWYRRIGYN